ncbi:uncharacterized protein ARMOST_01039 [Armillaria ostoyae]|uniref:Uncharacterized protein n=1 Tax=Armillaria ostoyae TaxID=47428 RepID=A0A284QMS8_ARMOS|nr:uncharacterized protein ARMOST_01039 [Armillaria ostoyae]
MTTWVRSGRVSKSQSLCLTWIVCLVDITAPKSLDKQTIRALRFNGNTYRGMSPRLFADGIHSPVYDMWTSFPSNGGGIHYLS